MAVSRRFSSLPVLLAFLAFSTFSSVVTVYAALPPEYLVASGGVVPQSGNCSAARPDDEQCLPQRPQSQTGPGQSVIPPVPPITPPITPPPFPPTPGRSYRQANQPDDPHSAQFMVGWAKATLHIHDENQDIKYESNRADLLFMKYGNQEGNTRYLLYGAPVSHDSGEVRSLSVTWTASGTVDDCKVEGQAYVTFPVGADPAADPTLPAYGQLNVISPDGGDFHSVMIGAFNRDARLKKICPGNPPTVTEELFEAGYLLHIVFRKNMYEERGLLVLSGMQVIDTGKPDAILDMLPPGSGRDIASQALSQAQASPSRTSRVYTWEWALYPNGNYDEGLGGPH